MIFVIYLIFAANTATKINAQNRIRNLIQEGPNPGETAIDLIPISMHEEGRKVVLKTKQANIYLQT